MRLSIDCNVHDKTGDETLCPGCGKAVIQRDWYRILGCALDDSGHCRHCGTAIAGRYGKFGKPFGPQLALDSYSRVTFKPSEATNVTLKQP